MTNTPPPFAQALDEHVKRAYERGREEDWAGLPSASTSAVDEAKQAIIAAHEAAVLAARIDLTNIADWTRRGLKSPAVAYKCLQMIEQELVALQSQGEEEDNAIAN